MNSVGGLGMGRKESCIRFTAFLLSSLARVAGHVSPVSASSLCYSVTNYAYS